VNVNGPDLALVSLASVSTMRTSQSLGYAKRNDYLAVTIPYNGGELQFLILLPDEVDGLESLVKQLTAATRTVSRNHGSTSR